MGPFGGIVGARVTGAARRTVVAGVAGLLVTAAVLLVPSLRFAYRSVEGHLVLETAVTLAGALVALLLYGRFRRSGRLQELLLVYAMAVLAVAAFGLVTLPALFGAAPGAATTTWAALVVRVLGAALILAAAVVPDRPVRRGRPLRDALVVMALLVAVAVVVEVLASGLPDAVRVQPAAETSGRPSFDAHPVVMAVQVANLLCYAGAAVGFSRQAARSGDELVGWFGAAAALGAWARVNYLLFPSLYSDWLYSGDLLRLGFYVLLLVGAVREIQAYWAAQAVAAAVGERRRLARDLHDGVVQELGYIRRQAMGLREAGGDGRGAGIVAAADRALDEARRSLRALTAPSDETLAETLALASCEVADRYDVPIHLDLDRTVSVPAEHREALVRIAREAVVNAARHGQGSRLWLRLDARAMSVRDDGRGFEVGRGGRAGGFGLTSMRERAEAMGAVFRVESAPGRGTEVTVTW